MKPTANCSAAIRTRSHAPGRGAVVVVLSYSHEPCLNTNIILASPVNDSADADNLLGRFILDGHTPRPMVMHYDVSITTALTTLRLPH
jgi:hypothetical protein